MFSFYKFSGMVLSCAVLVCFGALSGCQSTTGKTVGETMTDASISTAVQTKLTSDRLANFPRIDVDTERGVVSLNGIVETAAQRAQAERLARQVEGVVKVNNNLQLQNRPPTGRHPDPAQTHGMKESQPDNYTGQGDQHSLTKQTQGVDVIQGEVVRVDGDTYFVRGRDGKEISLHADTTTMKTRDIKMGDRVEVKVDRNNHALSMLPEAP
ncbi:MAG: BON domain-containing protein [Nitrospirales bacterium]